MQIWPYLPRLDADAPSIKAVIKRDPEDFLVEEVAAYEPCGEGEHLFLWIEKRDISAEGLLKHLAGQLRGDLPFAVDSIRISGHLVGQIPCSIEVVFNVMLR